MHSALGAGLPTRPNTWAGNSDCQVLWLGPDEWLVVSADGTHEILFNRLHEALHGLHHALTDVSANRTVIAIAGSDTRSVLAKGCSLDLHRQAFGERHLAQTLLAKSPVILQCVDGQANFHLYVRNSYAQYVATWLTDAQAECAASSGLDAGLIASRLG